MSGTWSAISVRIIPPSFSMAVRQHEWVALHVAGHWSANKFSRSHPNSCVCIRHSMLQELDMMNCLVLYMLLQGLQRPAISLGRSFSEKMVFLGVSVWMMGNWRSVMGEC